jgi:hypothetical protein
MCLNAHQQFSRAHLSRAHLGRANALAPTDVLRSALPRERFRSVTLSRLQTLR